VPGKNIQIEYRFGDGRTAETLRLAREIVDLKVDVIVAGGGLGTRAAQSVTTTIPIVMSSASDPVGTGLVASLARPGGNTTGTSIVSWELFAKPRAAKTSPPQRIARCGSYQPPQSGACQRLERSASCGWDVRRNPSAHRCAERR
jgi:hypothetical protein